MIKICAFADEYGNSFEEQMEGLRLNEIDLIELRNLDGKNVLDLTVEQAKDYCQKLAQKGISVWSLGSPIGKVSIHCDWQEYKQKVEHICRLANAFNCKRVRIFSFFNAYSCREKVIDYLQQMVNIAQSFGVELYHENEKEIYGDTVARVLDVLQSVNGLHSIYDPANYLQCQQNMQQALDELLCKADYFHVKDVIFATGELVPAGYGDGLFDEMISRLQGDFTFTLEPHLTLFTGYSAIDNTEMKSKLKFESAKDAFNFAAKSFKQVLYRNGYKKVAHNCYEK